MRRTAFKAGKNACPTNTADRNVRSTRTADSPTTRWPAPAPDCGIFARNSAPRDVFWSFSAIRAQERPMQIRPLTLVLPHVLLVLMLAPPAYAQEVDDVARAPAPPLPKSAKSHVIKELEV